MPLPRHRPNPKLLQSTNTDQEDPELLGDYHFAYRTGAHSPTKAEGLDPVYHSSCNICLTDLDADSPEGLREKLAAHGGGKCAYR